jgi:hypothetical protein
MFAQTKHIQPHLIGKLDFFQKVFQPARTLGTFAARRVRIDIRKCVETQFHV